MTTRTCRAWRRTSTFRRRRWSGSALRDGSQRTRNAWEVAVRVLGVDPGTVATGWGVVDQTGQRLRYVAGGVIRSRGALPQRLAHVYDEACRVLSEFGPECVSLEKTFVGENVQSAFRLGE